MVTFQEACLHPVLVRVLTRLLEPLVFSSTVKTDIFYVTEWNQSESSGSFSSFLVIVLMLVTAYGLLSSVPKLLDGWEGSSTHHQIVTPQIGTISSQIGLTRSNNLDSFGPLFPFRQSQIVQIIWIHPQIIVPEVWDLFLRVCLKDSKTKHTTFSAFTGRNPVIWEGISWLNAPGNAARIRSRSDLAEEE